jgi:hypothetical protein
MGSRWSHRTYEVIIMTETQKKEIAEKYISESRKDELHTCDTPESACVGCDMMRKGLRMLSSLGDPSIHCG